MLLQNWPIPAKNASLWRRPLLGGLARNAAPTPVGVSILSLSAEGCTNLDAVGPRSLRDSVALPFG